MCSSYIKEFEFKIIVTRDINNGYITNFHMQKSSELRIFLERLKINFEKSFKNFNYLDYIMITRFYLMCHNEIFCMNGNSNAQVYYTKHLSIDVLSDLVKELESKVCECFSNVMKIKRFIFKFTPTFDKYIEDRGIYIMQNHCSDIAFTSRLKQLYNSEIELGLKIQFNFNESINNYYLYLVPCVPVKFSKFLLSKMNKEDIVNGLINRCNKLKVEIITDLLEVIIKYLGSHNFYEKIIEILEIYDRKEYKKEERHEFIKKLLEDTFKLDLYNRKESLNLYQISLKSVILLIIFAYFDIYFNDFQKKVNGFCIVLESESDYFMLNEFDKLWKCVNDFMKKYEPNV